MPQKLKDKDKSDGTGKSDGLVRGATNTEADDDEDDEIEALIEADGSGDCEDNPKGVKLAVGQMSCGEVAGGKFSSKDGKKAGKRGLCEKSNLAKGNNGNRRRDGMAIEENCKKSCGLCGLGDGGGSGGGGSDSDSGSESKSKSKDKRRKSKSKRRKSESGSSSESESQSSLLEIVEDKDKSVGTGKSKGLMRMATNTQADDEDDEDKDKDKSDGTGKSDGLVRGATNTEADDDEDDEIEALIEADGSADCEDNPNGVTLEGGQMSCEDVAGAKFSKKDGKKAGKRGMCQKSNLLKGKGDRRRDGMKIEENCKKSCGLCGLEGGGGRRRKDSGGGRRRKDSGGERRRKDSGGEAGGGGGCKPGMIRRGGKNVVVKTGSNSRSQCEADCKANSECVAFDYTTNEQSDSCRGVKEVQGDKDPRWGKNDDGREVCIMGSGGGSGGTSKGKGSSGGGSSGNGSGGEGGGGGGCKPGLIRRGGKNV